MSRKGKGNETWGTLHSPSCASAFGAAKQVPHWAFGPVRNDNGFVWGSFARRLSAALPRWCWRRWGSIRSGKIENKVKVKNQEQGQRQSQRQRTRVSAPHGHCLAFHVDSRGRLSPHFVRETSAQFHMLVLRFQACLRHASLPFRLYPPVNWRAIFAGPYGTMGVIAFHVVSVGVVVGFGVFSVVGIDAGLDGYCGIS
jgi:hypothetical protein